jgi:hypothetical protein
MAPEVRLVEPDRPGDVAEKIGMAVWPDIEDDETRVPEMVFEPLRGYPADLRHSWRVSFCIVHCITIRHRNTLPGTFRSMSLFP